MSGTGGGGRDCSRSPWLPPPRTASGQACGSLRKQELAPNAGGPCQEARPLTPRTPDPGRGRLSPGGVGHLAHSVPCRRGSERRGDAGAGWPWASTGRPAGGCSCSLRIRDLNRSFRDAHRDASDFTWSFPNKLLSAHEMMGLKVGDKGGFPRERPPSGQGITLGDSVPPGTCGRHRKDYSVHTFDDFSVTEGDI